MLSLLLKIKLVIKKKIQIVKKILHTKNIRNNISRGVFKKKYKKFGIEKK